MDVSGVSSDLVDRRHWTGKTFLGYNKALFDADVWKTLDGMPEAACQSFAACAILGTPYGERLGYPCETGKTLHLEPRLW